MAELLTFSRETYNEEIKNFLDKNYAPLTQYDFYGNWQKAVGRDVYEFSIRNSAGELVLYSQAISIPAGLKKKFLYCPYGPIISKKISENPVKLTELLNFLNEKISTFLREIDHSFLRLDFTPNIDNFAQNSPNLTLKRAPKWSEGGSFFQPRLETALNLSKGVDDLYSEIDSKNRYAIRLAERKGIKIEIILENFLTHFETFYQMIKDTADRNSFNLHSKKYYLEIFKDLDKRKNGRLVLAKVDETIATCLVFVDFNKTTMFLLGASLTELNKKVPTSHLAHWKNIEFAKKSGLEIYNFGGISKEKSRSDSLSGVTMFKRRFGGYEIKHSDYYDLVVDKIGYRIFLFKKWLRWLKNLI
ncbi:MAG TPA: peptidoglycan bridge formation glycyltransferase FemA/FemB family protein [Candidatus Paceibacterota bacterium]|nr:peptidoglycan bridge formation glycyltransferase FemA/FemB family protein [Candidatus Paceibacterota bacterium]HRZ34562.1 peptidoglycan bridge formation glycyltransferase FemA/FemB family protein [Candidatus Paceibacterota bacterium]